MLKHRLIHPKINEVLGRAGHHGKVLIADGNYPASSTLGPNAELVSLNHAASVAKVRTEADALRRALAEAGFPRAALVAAPQLRVEAAHEPREARVDHRGAVLEPVRDLGELLFL